MKDFLEKLSHIKLEGSNIKSVEQALIAVLEASTRIMETGDNNYHAGCNGCTALLSVCTGGQYYACDWVQPDRHSIRTRIRDEFLEAGKFDTIPNPSWKWFKFWEPKCIYPDFTELDKEIYFLALEEIT